PRSAVDLLCAIEILRDLIAPVAEGALGELHDVAFVHEGHALAPVFQRVADCAVDEALGAESTDGLESDANLDADGALRPADRLELLLPVARRLVGTEPNLAELLRKFFREEVEHLLGVWRSCDVLDARVDVFRVLTEDHHVHFFRMPHRRRDALEPSHWPQTDIKVQQLSQRAVQRPDAAADRRRQRSLDADEVVAERLDSVVGQPRVEALEAFLAGEDLEPRDAPRATVRFLDRRVEHTYARAPDVGSSAVAFDERNDRIVGNDETTAAASDRCAHRELIRSGHL